MQEILQFQNLQLWAHHCLEKD